MKIAVVGLGYVGLPLSLQFARSCTEVIGIDVDPQKVKLLNDGKSYIKHVSEAGIREMVNEGRFIATTDFSRIKEVEAVIICVPTPLTKNREPDISYVIETGRSIAPYLKSAEADLRIEDGRSKIGDAGSRAPHPTLSPIEAEREKLWPAQPPNFQLRKVEDRRLKMEDRRSEKQPQSPNSQLRTPSL